ncbi:MAG: hypothetical protein U5K30_12350 [Acidimicrobiales bacterium]|nr:hypothetical protein [Acidimicrobiales bacterium]
MTSGELSRLLVELRDLRLQPTDWAEVEHLLASIESGGDDRVEQLSQVVFEARVRRSFSGPKASSDVVPTKQTSALPVVGVVCGGLLIAVGALLGGGIILVAIVLLAVFVFAIAFAGSRVAHRNADVSDSPAEQPVPVPDQVRLRIDELESRSD